MSRVQRYHKKKVRIRWPQLIVVLVIFVLFLNGLGFLAFNMFGRGTEALAKEKSGIAAQVLQTVKNADLDPYDVDTPIVKTALKEVGNKGGDKFWKWYGFNYHVAWCGCFVGWCADQNGYIEKGLVPKFAYVPDGVNWFKANDLWKSYDEKPESGDIIFFTKDRKKGLGSHVGIVANVIGSRVYTVEGNSRNRVRKHSYSLNSRKILGYGEVKEEESKN
ncbi:MAG: CHAP domain-containing protein [Anaerovoracaceae bacterium]|jgi:hypothetical protein